MKFKLRGKLYEVVREGSEWASYICGEGKRRPADIKIPPSLPEEKLIQYLNDYFHEILSPEHPSVVEVE